MGVLELQWPGATLCCRAQASYCGGFSPCRAPALGCLGVSSCGTQALDHVASHSCGSQALVAFSIQNLPRAGIEPLSPALAYGFLSTAWTVPTRLFCPLESPGKNTGVGCHFLLQGFFLTQELNPGLLHCRQILYHLSYQESPVSTEPQGKSRHLYIE